METCACSKNRRDFSLFSPCEQKLLPDSQLKEKQQRTNALKNNTSKMEGKDESDVGCSCTQQIGTIFTLLTGIQCIIYINLTSRVAMGVVLFSFFLASLCLSLKATTVDEAMEGVKNVGYSVILLLAHYVKLLLGYAGYRFLVFLAFLGRLYVMFGGRAHGSLSRLIRLSL